MGRLALPRVHTILLTLLAAGPILIVGASVLSPLAPWKGVGLAALLASLLALLPLLHLRVPRRQRRRLSASVISALVTSTVLFGLFIAVPTVGAEPDTFYLHDTATSGITPAGEFMNETQGTVEATVAFDTAGQEAYWYVDETWPPGSDNMAIAAGSYTFNMYFNELPRPWWNSSYAYRRQVTVTAGASAIPTNYSVNLTFDHAALVAASKSQADGDDVRVAYWNGTAWVERDRILDADAMWDNASTKIWWETDAPVAASGTDANYYLYYGNTSAANPPISATPGMGIRTVQNGTATSSANGFVNVTINPVNTSTSFLFFSSRADSNRPPGSYLRGRLYNATTVQFERVTNEASPVTMTMSWYVVEYYGGVNVQRGESVLNSYTLNITISAVSAVDQAFATWSKTPADVDNSWDQNDPQRCWLSNTTNLRCVGSSTSTHILWWEVIEFTNAADIDVQTGNAYFPGATTTTSSTLSPAVNTSRTFVLAGFNASNGGSDVGARMLRANLTSATEVTIDRSISGSPDPLTATWQTIELNDGSRVFYSSLNFASSVAQQTVNIGATVDLNRSVAFATVQPAGGQSMGRSPFTGDDVIGVGSFTVEFASATQITLTRDNTSDSSDVVWTVVEFEREKPSVSDGVEETTANVQITVSVYHTRPNGTDPQEIVTSSTITIDNGTANPFPLSIGTGAQHTFTASDPRRLRLHVNLTAANGGERFILAYNSSANPSNLNSPSVSFTPKLTNPTLTPTSGTPSTFFNFTVDYSHPSGLAADLVQVNVSDATNGTFNNFTMSPTQTPEVDYFVQENWAINGTVNDFANAQSSTDSGASALLVQEGGAGGSTNFYQVEQLTEQNTTSTTWTDIPGTNLTFTPGSTGEIWLIFATGRMSSSTTEEQAYEMRLVINGVEESIFSSQHNAAGQTTYAGFAVFNRITGTTASQTVKLQFQRLTAGTVYADDLRVIAALLPSGADFQFVEDESQQQLAGANLNILTLTFTPSSAGDYIILAEVSHREHPSGSTSETWFEDESGGVHFGGDHHANGREPWNPFFIALNRSLGAGSQTVRIRGDSSGDGNSSQDSQWRDARIMAFRMDAFDATYYSENLAQGSTTATTYQQRNSLTVPAPPTGQDFLVIQSAIIADSSAGTVDGPRGELRDDGSPVMETAHVINRALVDWAEIVTSVRVKTSSSSHTYANGWFSSSASVTAYIMESTITVLRWPAPSDSILLVQFNTTGIRSSGEDTLVLRYNLTAADDTFGLWVWNFTASDWTQRGTLDQTALSFFNYTLEADEKSSGEVRIRFNDTSVAGSTNLSVDYQLVNNTLWKAGVTYFYNTTLAAGSYQHFFWANDTNGNVVQTSTLPGPTVNAAPVVTNFRLENATGASRTGEQLDVDIEYFFLFNVTDENGWTDIGDDGNVSLRLWYDGNQTPELTFDQQTTGANYRIELKYVDTADPSTASLGEWSVMEGQATYNASASSLTAITNGYEFKLALRLGFQIRQANDPTNSSTGDYNDNNSWNGEVIASDGSLTATLQTASTGEHLEFGVYMFTFVNISADWTVNVNVGQTASTNTVTVYYRANDDFKMTIWFTTHLVNASDTIDISNVQILAAADPNDNITSDFAFVGLGQGNSTHIFGSATWWFVHNASANENTVSVRFSVTVPFGTLNGDYTANLTIRIEQRPAS